MKIFLATIKEWDGPEEQAFLKETTWNEMQPLEGEDPLYEYMRRVEITDPHLLLVVKHHAH